MVFGVAVPARILPSTSSFSQGLLVPIPTFHPAWIRTFSVAFVRITRSTLSVVPRKFVVAVVPAFPRTHHPANDPVAAVSQLARPVASETRIFPSPGDPPVILTCPATSSRAHGAAVPIPTSPLFCIRMSSVRVHPATFAEVIVAVLSFEKIIGFTLFVDT